MATALKTLISPYLLRRTKSEVQHHIFLPNKKEQVLFCKLTNEQNDLYKGYLMVSIIFFILFYFYIHTFYKKSKKFCRNKLTQNLQNAISV